MQIAVVTKTDPTDLTLPLGGLFYSDGADLGDKTLVFRQPVFMMGEILILDGDGREIGGRMRKPDKWDVTIEIYRTIEDAVTRAEEVMRGVQA